MMASVSIAARDSLRVSIVSLLKSQERSLAVRKVHLPPTQTRLTPRIAYSSCRRVSAAGTSTPAGSRAARALSSSGSAEANSIASSSRSSSGRTSSALCGSSLGMITRLARLDIRYGLPFPSIPLFLAVHVDRRITRNADAAGGDTLAHVDRRERLLLMNIGISFPHQFERGGKARGEHRCRQCGVDHVGYEIFVQPRPIRRSADQTLEHIARLGQRPDGALGKMQVGQCTLLPLGRIGGKQIVEGRRPFRALDVGDRLGLTPAEYVAIEQRPPEQA